MSEVSLKQLDARSRKRIEIARTAVQRGNFGYAVEICTALLKSDPRCLEMRELLREAQLKDFDARGDSAVARARARMGAATLVLYGKPYLKKDPALAMDYGERALAKMPMHAGALSLVAAGAEALKLWKTVVFCLRLVCDPAKSDFATLQRYCQALIQVGDTDEAVAIAERLRRLKPESPVVQELVKSASVAHSINRGKWAAEDDYRSKLSDEKQSEALERSTRLVQDGESAALRARDLLESIQQDPQALDLYKELVRVYLFLNDYEAALKWVDKAFQLPQADSDVILKQLRSEILINGTELELQQLNAALANEGASEKEKAERTAQLTQKLEGLRLEEARKIVSQFPNDYGQRLSLGELLLKSGDIDAAIKEFQVAQRSTGLRQRASVLLGHSFSRKGLHDLALQQYDAAIETVPGMDNFKKDVLYASARACESLGNADEAARRYKLIYAHDIGFRDVASKVDKHYAP